MSEDPIKTKPVSGFTRFEAKFVRQSGLSKARKIVVSFILAVLVGGAMFFTVSELGHLNDDIAGVFDPEGEVQLSGKAPVIKRGATEAAEASDGDLESPDLDAKQGE